MADLTRSSLLRPVRDRLGRWLHSRIDAVAGERVRRELAAERAGTTAAEPAAPATETRRWGPDGNIWVSPTVELGDALLDCSAGAITVAENVVFGHGVALLAGAHELRHPRPGSTPEPAESGRDIVVGARALVASRAVLVGPCRIGENAVVAPGAVVDADVPAGAIVAGNPARISGWVDERPALPPSVRVLTDVGVLHVHAHDEVMTPLLRLHGRWESHERQMLEAELSPGAVAVDVGANVGYMTIAAANRVGPGGLVIAVEPHPANVALLEANIAINGVAPRVRVVAGAAWSQPGTVELAESPSNTGDHRVETLRDERATLQVEAVRLDDVVPGDARVAVIKLDTQGTEHHVLAGAQALLARDRPVILTEFWPRGLQDRGEDPVSVLAALGRLGYAVELPEEPALEGLQPGELVERIDALSPQEGGFTTLRLRPRPL